MLLNGKNAVITGCTRGIGKATLETFVANGANVYSVVRNATDEFCQFVTEFNSKYGATITVIEADFSEEESVKSAAKAILSSKVKIDVLVNNVGMAYSQNAFMMSSITSIKETFQVNFFSHLLLTQLLSKNMVRNQSGSIIFVSSAAAFDGGANVGYVSSKAALVGASKRLALELGSLGIRVNSVAPGLTDTELTKNLSEQDEQLAFAMNIIKRKAKPKEIADAILFLASDLSTFVTAQVLHVDGGIR